MKWSMNHFSGQVMRSTIHTCCSQSSGSSRGLAVCSRCEVSVGGRARRRTHTASVEKRHWNTHIKGERCEKKQLQTFSQSSVRTTGGITNVVSRKRLACCSVGDVHLNTIDFIAVPAPAGTNSADLIDQGPLHCKFNKTAENPRHGVPASPG